MDQAAHFLVMPVDKSRFRDSCLESVQAGKNVDFTALQQEQVEKSTKW